MDALAKTVFRQAPGTDSCVIAVFAMKAKVAADDEAGMHLEILPMSLGEAALEFRQVHTLLKEG